MNLAYFFLGVFFGASLLGINALYKIADAVEQLPQHQCEQSK